MNDPFLKKHVKGVVMFPCHFQFVIHDDDLCVTTAKLEKNCLLSCFVVGGVDVEDFQQPVLYGRLVWQRTHYLLTIIPFWWMRFQAYSAPTEVPRRLDACSAVMLIPPSESEE